MAEAFGIKSKKKTKDEDYEFPIQIPYIAKMQDKDKSLMKELMKSDHHTAMDAFHNNWLCHYPRPIQVMFDNSSELKSV
jgi:hypothetical protein